MNRLKNLRDLPRLVILGAFSGLCIGGLVGGSVGVIFLLLLIIGDLGNAEIGVMWLVFLLAFLGGCSFGMVAGTVGGALLGSVFYYVRSRFAGVTGGGFVGWVVCAELGRGPAALNLQTTAEVWALFVPGIVGGAIAGYAVAYVLHRHLDGIPKCD